MSGLDDAVIEDAGYRDFLQEILDGKHLEGAAVGITKKVIAEGEQNLSPKQRYVFQHQVLGEFVTEECSRCFNEIPWSEMYGAYENDGRCGWCQHHVNKGE